VVAHKTGIAGGLASLVISGIAYYNREKIINYLGKKL
jgi:hypothetical protein